jgi:hypothetical protein
MLAQNWPIVDCGASFNFLFSICARATKLSADWPYAKTVWSMK